MIPSTDERIASVIRALTEVILPHLPPEASLAQEQTHLAIGHLQILRAQLDAIPAFEREELEDAKAVGTALVSAIVGGSETSAAIAALKNALGTTEFDNARGQTRAIHLAVEALVRAVSKDGAADAKAKLTSIILEHEPARVEKDRRWCLPFGFDTMDAE